jgi:ABC-type phosphate transport system substrate-binding protein
MTRKLLAIALLMLALEGTLCAQDADAFKVIVNRANTAASLRRSEVSDLFLKKATRWPQGGAAAPVDQSLASPVRKAFSKVVLGRGVDAVQNYWQQQIFSGRAVPPHVKASDAEVVAFVQSTPGAIGYVSPNAVLNEEVKTLKLNP